MMMSGESSKTLSIIPYQTDSINYHIVRFPVVSFEQKPVADWDLCFLPNHDALDLRIGPVTPFLEECSLFTGVGMDSFHI